jgi:hypothetical protein
MRVGLNDTAQAIATRGERRGAFGNQGIPHETVLVSDEADLSETGFRTLGGNLRRVLMPLRRFLFRVCHELLDGIRPRCHSVSGAPFAGAEKPQVLFEAAPQFLPQRTLLHSAVKKSQNGMVLRVKPT